MIKTIYKSIKGMVEKQIEAIRMEEGKQRRTRTGTGQVQTRRQVNYCGYLMTMNPSRTARKVYDRRNIRKKSI